MFVSPRANSIFLQNYTGQQGLKPALHWEKRLREDGKSGYVDTQFSSQMEVFHVVNTEMPTQQSIGAASLFAIHAHIATPLCTRTDEECNKIHHDRCLSRKPVRDIFNWFTSSTGNCKQWKENVNETLNISQRMQSGFSREEPHSFFGESWVLNKW